MPRFLLGLAFFVLVLAPAPVPAAVVSLEEALAEKSIGSADAPVVMHEYASLSCPFCAAFQNDILPKIKAAYINTGKVRLVYHDFPLGELAVTAAMVARCSGDKNFFPLIDALYKDQKSWSRSDTPLDALAGIARLGGMSEDDVYDCVENEALLAEIQKRAKEAKDVKGVHTTPTFFIEGLKIPGNLPFEDFQDILDKALAAK